MTYQETIDYLFSQLPSYERQGAGGYKPGLQTSHDLDDLFGNPHKKYRCIHVAGTNGKGSVSSMIAAVLQMAGYKVGLFTSPHFIDFRERIRVNGGMIPRHKVVEFMERYFEMHYDGAPSFFELTSTMAMDYFAQCEVDYAVIEVGMGGRLDSTNIITPMLSVITNIALDHTQFLGDTLAQVAGEKAGIIKPSVPVVIGESCEETHDVFADAAQRGKSPITFAQDEPEVLQSRQAVLTTRNNGKLRAGLTGDYQVANINTVLTALAVLREQGVHIPAESVKAGIENAHLMTGLVGRWMQVHDKPRVVCDSGHNIGAFPQLMEQLKRQQCNVLRVVIGFMADKDVQHLLEMLPKRAQYYFTQASTSRAMKATELAELAAQKGLQGRTFETVVAAYRAAMADANEDDFVFVGGSMYVLAEFLPMVPSQHEL